MTDLWTDIPGDPGHVRIPIQTLQWFVKREAQLYKIEEEKDKQMFAVGQQLPGYCCGSFHLDTMDDDLRVEAVGVDWVVVRAARDGVVSFYTGDLGELEAYAKITLEDRKRAEEER